MTDESNTAIPPVAPSQSGTARAFLQRIEQGLTQFATLRIVTVIGDVDVTGADLATAVAIRPNASAEAASSEIDLLNGRITNIFSPGFAALGGGAVQAFHQSQVEKSGAIVTANLAELQRLAGALLSGRR